MNKIQRVIVFAGALCVYNAGHAQEPHVQNPDVQTQNILQQQLPLAPNLPLIMEVFGEYQEMLGYSVLATGDINGDGWPDFGVSAYKPGELRIYLGGPGILDSLPDLVLKGGRNAVSGDINGDGINDLVTVKRNIWWDTVYFYFGRNELPYRYSNEPDLSFTPSGDLSDQFAQSLKAGDFNGDGFADIAISDRFGGGGEGHGQANGMVYIYLGTTIPDSIPDIVLNKAVPYHSQFGYVLQVGDVNADGYDDLAVGWDYQNYDTNPDSLFTAKLIYLGGPSFNPVFESPDQYFDSRQITGSLYDAFLADVNNDGFADFIFEGEGFNGHVRLGSASGVSSMVNRIIPRPGGMRWNGIVRLDHDITGDGYRDYVMHNLSFGAGFSCFFRGSKDWITNDFASQWPWYVDEDYGDLNCNRVCSLGDVNGDGRNDIIVSGKYSPGSRGVFHILSGIGPPVAAEQLKAAPEVLAITSVRPNPSSGPVEMDLNTPASSVVRVTVHDAFGRELCVISDAHLIPGTHTLRWDGTDAGGTRVAPGLYLLRTVCRGTAVTSRVLRR